MPSVSRYGVKIPMARRKGRNSVSECCPEFVGPGAISDADTAIAPTRPGPACAHGERALEDLAFFSHQVKILGVYPAHPYRLHGEAGENTYRPG